MFDDYLLNALRNGENKDYFDKRMAKFKLFDQFTMGDSTVLNNQKTDKGFLLKYRITSANPELFPNVILYELHEADPTGFSVVYIAMNEQAYSDFGNVIENAIHSYTWKPFIPPQ